MTVRSMLHDKRALLDNVLWVASLFGIACVGYVLLT